MPVQLTEVGCNKVLPLRIPLNICYCSLHFSTRDQVHTSWLHVGQLHAVRIVWPDYAGNVDLHRLHPHHATRPEQQQEAGHRAHATKPTELVAFAGSNHVQRNLHQLTETELVFGRESSRWTNVVKLAL